MRCVCEQRGSHGSLRNRGGGGKLRERGTTGKKGEGVDGTLAKSPMQRMADHRAITEDQSSRPKREASVH